MADILRPIQPGDSWVTDEFGNVTGVALSLAGQQTKLPRLTNSGTTPAASQQVALVSGVPINSTPIGQTTPAAVKTSNLQATFTDSSGTPGNVTNNSPRGLVAIAAAATAVTVTSSIVTATSLVVCQLQTVDGTLTNVNSVVPAAGSFTITGNAAATGITKVAFFVVN